MRAKISTIWLFVFGVLLVYGGWYFGFLHLSLTVQAEQATTIEEPPERPTLANPVVVRVYGPDGSESSDVKPTVLTVGDKLRVDVPEPNGKFRPGKYTLKMWVLRHGTIYYTENQFIWGVFALNYNKSVFTVGDSAYLQMAVLSDDGNTVCDASVRMTLTSPTGKTIVLSTANDAIVRSPSCGPNNVTQAPDYFAHLTLEESGTYAVSTHVVNRNGARDFGDVLIMQDTPAFSVERSGPTRIFPPAEYEMTLIITANEDYAGPVIETVPEGFAVYPNPAASIEEANGNMRLTWQLDLKKGDVATLSYRFNAPDISPELFKLGPLALDGWQETRSWQLASDITTNQGSVLVSGNSTSTFEDALRRWIRTPTSTWSASGTTVDATAETFKINHVVIKAAPTRNEYIAGHLKTGGRVDFIRFANGATWSTLFGAATTTPTQNCDADFTKGNCWQAFDLGYEQLSGEALMVYARNTSSGVILYRTWDGNVSSTENAFTYNTAAGATKWMRLIPQGERLTDNRSNNMLLMLADASNTYAMVWDGTTFINTTTLTTNNPPLDTRYFNGAWETVSGRAIVVYASGSLSSTTPFFYETYGSGSVWTAPTAVSSVTSTIGVWVNMASDPLSDRIALGITTYTGALTSGRGWPLIWRADTSTPSWTLGYGTGTMEAATAPKVNPQFMRYGTSTLPGTSTAIFVIQQSSTAPMGSFRAWVPAGFGNNLDLPGTWADDENSEKLVGSPNSNEMLLFGASIDSDLQTQRLDERGVWQAGPSAALNIAVATSVDNANHENNAYDFAFQPYAPWARNWRWYSGTSTEDTPTVALANENVSTTYVSPVSGHVRLRYNVAELGGAAETDTRKILEWTTSTTPDASSTIWTDVGNIGSSTIWRYYDVSSTSAGGDDGDVLAGMVLSSSTIAGWWNTHEFDHASSSMDHRSSTVLELEFPIEANNPPASTTFFFRMYDQYSTATMSYDIGTPIYRQQTVWPATPCLGNSACSYPSLKTGINTPPIAQSFTINSAGAITLIGNATKTITVNYQVFDPDGCEGVFTNGNVTTTLYLGNMSSSCAVQSPEYNPSFCYVAATTTNNCVAGNVSANVTTTFDLWYFARASDSSSSASSYDWRAFVAMNDTGGGATSTTSSASGVELNTLVSISSDASSLNYGSVNVGSNSGASTTAQTIENVGNASTTLKVNGTAMTFGSNFIATSSQHYATSTFTYGGGEQALQVAATAVSGWLASAAPLGSTWASTTSLRSNLLTHSAVVSNGFLYVMGGYNGGTYTSTVQYTPINSTGSLGAWATTTPLPSTLGYHSAVVNNGFLYVMGGYNGGTYTSTVQYTPINSTGSLGAWATTTPLPSTLGYHSAVVNNGFLYVTGGSISGATFTSTVQYAPINATGSLGAWATTTPLLSILGCHSAVVNNGFLYVTGGSIDCSTYTSTVQYAPINATGSLGAWATTTPLLSVLGAHSAVVNNGFLYVTGGTISGANFTSTVQYALLNASGSLGTWATTTPLRSTLGYHSAVVNNGFLYVTGGWVGGVNYTSSVQYAALPSKNLYWGISVSSTATTGNYTSSITYTAVYSP